MSDEQNKIFWQAHIVTKKVKPVTVIKETDKYIYLKNYTFSNKRKKNGTLSSFFATRQQAFQFLENYLLVRIEIAKGELDRAIKDYTDFLENKESEDV